ncbi:p25-alpha-domain-containing protein [Gorgonomyces haynaldii]|nr:p25-alpha-domain-containing protein [Gorgonomyces haynaldii]
MIDLGEVEEIYNRFCTFGSRTLNQDLGTWMDNSKFAKLCRDTKIVGGKITPTDVDIIFNKVRTKNPRKIDFDEFLQGLKLLGAIKFPEKEPLRQFHLMCDIVVNGKPKVKATSVQSDPVTQRLTDTSQYTGTSKNRFDDNGKGLGMTLLGSQANLSKLSRDNLNKRAESKEMLQEGPTKLPKIGSKGNLTRA